MFIKKCLNNYSANMKKNLRTYLKCKLLIKDCSFNKTKTDFKEKKLKIKEDHFW